jgi:hypothetical protein
METDIFLLVVIVLIFLFLIYFVVVAIYSREVLQLKIPGVSESTFLFWVSIVMVAVAVLVIVLLLWRLFSPPVCKPKIIVQEKPVVKTVVTKKSAPRVYDTSTSSRKNQIPSSSSSKAPLISPVPAPPISSIRNTEPISTIPSDSQLLAEERLSGL